MFHFCNSLGQGKKEQRVVGGAGYLKTFSKISKESKIR
jgi:hypothetical protein